jgi:hypothetical protein
MILKTIRKISASLYVVLALGVPFMVFGQATGGLSPTQLKNPIGYDDIKSFFLAILEIIIIFAVPIIVFFIIYAGFMFVTANGNAEKIKSARSAITWAIVGGLLILGAKILLDVIQATVDALK